MQEYLSDAKTSKSLKRTLQWLTIIFCMALLCYLLYSLLSPLYGIPYDTQFISLMNFRGSDAFGDLNAILGASGCDGTSPSLVYGARLCNSAPGEPTHAGYPPLPMVIGSHIGIDSSSTEVVAVVMGLLFSLVTWIIVKGRKDKDDALSLAFFCAILYSFGVQLGLERMNIDIVIFLLVGTLSYAYGKLNYPSNSRWRKFWSITCIVSSFAAVAIKAYPAAGIFLWAFLERTTSKKKPRYQHGTLVIGVIAGILTFLPWLFLGESMPKPGVGLVSHSLLIGSGVDSYSSYASIYSLLIFCSVLVVLAKTIIRTSGIRSEIRKYFGGPGFRNTFARLGLAIWLGCYTINTNYDYRMVFLIPIIVSVSACLSNSNSAVLRRIAAIIIVVAVTKSFNPYLYQFSVENSATASRLVFGFISKSMDIVGMPVMAASLVNLLLFSYNIQDKAMFRRVAH